MPLPRGFITSEQAEDIAVKAALEGGWKFSQLTDVQRRGSAYDVVFGFGDGRVEVRVDAITGNILKSRFPAQAR